jgi:hypothetical protein
MLGDAIRLTLTNIPLIMFVLAFVLAALTSGSAASKADHYLGWVLLLAVGAASLWAGLYHVLAPRTAAAYIGWQPSPFQFEIGIADIAFGVAAMASFWRSLEFKAAVIVYAVIFYAGVVYGHIHQVMIAGDFAPGNFGVLLLLSIVLPVLLVGLLWSARRRPRAT